MTILSDKSFAHKMAALGPFEAEPHLAIAVSGGGDSMALVLLADQWAKAQGGQVTALTVDHGLRAESAREAAQVALDTSRGLVSIEGAKRYGVVLDESFNVDQRATDDLRQRMKTERGEVQLFDRGGTMEELKARCMADTHLEPPTTPVFQKWMGREDVGQREAAE